eukprot:353210-Chlamydomonas_euryale.AAC.1
MARGARPRRREQVRIGARRCLLWGGTARACRQRAGRWRSAAASSGGHRTAPSPCPCSSPTCPAAPGTVIEGTVGDAGGMAQWTTREGGHSGRRGRGGTVDDAGGRAQWTTREGGHSGRRGREERSAGLPRTMSGRCQWWVPHEYQGLAAAKGTDESLGWLRPNRSTHTTPHTFTPPHTQISPPRRAHPCQLPPCPACPVPLPCTRPARPVPMACTQRGVSCATHLHPDSSKEALSVSICESADRLLLPLLARHRDVGGALRLAADWTGSHRQAHAQLDIVLQPQGGRTR